jgi:DNA-binding MltR family transcriptional regulator
MTSNLVSQMNDTKAEKSTPSDIKEVFRNLGQIMRESDQKAAVGHAIYLGSIAADLLKQAIEDRFVPLSRDLKDALFDGYGPLASFKGRIDVAFALAAITRKTRTEMHKLRQIRNKFAHTTDKIDFRNEEVIKLCMKLVAFDQKTGNAQDAYVRTIHNMIDDIYSQEYERPEIRPGATPMPTRGPDLSGSP